MKSLPSDYSHYDIPELEETEFALSVSPCPLIKDSKDIGDTDDSFSAASIIVDAMFREFDSQ
jgi:hypothetical protein